MTPKLAPLHYYQLSLQAPKPPPVSFNHAAAERGEARLQRPGQLRGLPHAAALHGRRLQRAQAGRDLHRLLPGRPWTDGAIGSTYVTPQLKGLWARSKRGFFHDGRHPTLGAVINHYDGCFGLNLSAGQKSDLVEFLKSL